MFQNSAQSVSHKNSVPTTERKKEEWEAKAAEPVNFTAQIQNQEIDSGAMAITQVELQPVEYLSKQDFNNII